MNHRERTAESVRRRHDELTAMRRAHPDWPICTACRWPINPAALVGGYTTHPTCDRSAA